jgi:hypothetical protein
MMAAGDVTTQLAIEKSTKLDQRRTAVCSSYNACYAVPLMRWYGLLDRWFPPSTTLVFVSKSLVNQVVSSLLIPTGFLTWTSILEEWANGNGVSAGLARAGCSLRRDGTELICKSFCVWLPANMTMFLVVPVPFRVAWVSTVAVGWGAYCSLVAHHNQPGARTGEELQSSKAK